jgi:PEP-CTERM motif
VSEGSVFGPVFLPNASVVNDVASLGTGANRAVGRSSDGGPGAPAAAWDLELHPDGSFGVAGSSILAPGQPSEAYAITEQGDVSGQVLGTLKGANLDAVEDNAFVIRNGSLKLLKAGGGNREGIGFDLNDTDVVGGTAPYYWTPVRYATLWNSRNQPEDLSGEYFGDNWSRAIAYGINDDGEIVGDGTLGGVGHAWLLRAAQTALSAGAAVPEPSTLLFLGLGLATLLSTHRRSLWAK